MTTVEEIEHAIRALSSGDRTRLARALPAIIPELDGDILWESIARDSAPRPSLSVALDEMDAQFAHDPGRFRPIQAGDFEQAR